MTYFPDEVEVIENSGVTVRGSRHRTTVPIQTFKLMGLQNKDKLRWVCLKNGTAIVSKTKEVKI